MSLADDVHALELERDTLQAELAAARAALAGHAERGSLKSNYWKSRATDAEARVALLEAYDKLRPYANGSVQGIGEWHVRFSYNGADPAGLDFAEGNLAQMLSGLLMSWFDRPAPLTLEVSPPKSAEQRASREERQDG